MAKTYAHLAVATKAPKNLKAAAKKMGKYREKLTQAFVGNYN